MRKWAVLYIKGIASTERIYSVGDAITHRSISGFITVRKIFGYREFVLFPAKTQRPLRLSGEESHYIFHIPDFQRQFTAEPQRCRRLRRENNAARISPYNNDSDQIYLPI
jgi:hypothetical protein